MIPTEDERHALRELVRAIERRVRVTCGQDDTVTMARSTWLELQAERDTLAARVLELQGEIGEARQAYKPSIVARVDWEDQLERGLVLLERLVGSTAGVTVLVQTAVRALQLSEHAAPTIEEWLTRPAYRVYVANADASAVEEKMGRKIKKGVKKSVARKRFR